jgi:hypothetical protein
MSNLYPRAKLIWSLANSGYGTTIAAAGNSGAWSSATPNAETLIDLRDVCDLALMVSVTAVTSSPTVVATLNVFDDAGNAYATTLTSGNITALGAKLVCGGLHGPTTSYLVLPAWGQMAWTCSGGTTTGTEIALYAR